MDVNIKQEMLVKEWLTERYGKEKMESVFDRILYELTNWHYAIVKLAKGNKMEAVHVRPSGMMMAMSKCRADFGIRIWVNN